MFAGARDTAEATVPPQSAVSGETRPLVEAKVAAPGAEPRKDAEQEASEEIARSDALLKAWGRGFGATAQAKQPFDVTVQPVVSGEDAAIELKGVTAELSVEELMARIHATKKELTPDRQRLFIAKGDQQPLRDETLPIGAYGVLPGVTTLHLAMRDADEAKARREARAALRAARAEAAAEAEARWQRQKALMLATLKCLLGCPPMEGVEREENRCSLCAWPRSQPPRPAAEPPRAGVRARTRSASGAPLSARASCLNWPHLPTSRSARFR